MSKMRRRATGSFTIYSACLLAFVCTFHLILPKRSIPELSPLILEENWTENFDNDYKAVVKRVKDVENNEEWIQKNIKNVFLRRKG